MADGRVSRVDPIAEEIRKVLLPNVRSEAIFELAIAEQKIRDLDQTFLDSHFFCQHRVPLTHVDEAFKDAVSLHSENGFVSFLVRQTVDSCLVSPVLSTSRTDARHTGVTKLSRGALIGDDMLEIDVL